MARKADGFRGAIFLFGVNLTETGGRFLPWDIGGCLSRRLSGSASTPGGAREGYGGVPKGLQTHLINNDISVIHDWASQRSGSRGTERSSGRRPAETDSPALGHLTPWIRRCTKGEPMSALVRFALLIGLLVSCTAAAQGLRMDKSVALSAAAEAATAAVRECARAGHAVAAAVVDHAGNLKVLLRADGASPHTVDSSRRKAYTAAALGMSTARASELASRPDAVRLGDIRGFLLLGGGIPIKAGSDVVGAIGVGGAPGGAIDENCAAAGLAAIAERLR